jgi:hypothetical protein
MDNKLENLTIIQLNIITQIEMLPEGQRLEILKCFCYDCGEYIPKGKCYCSWDD